MRISIAADGEDRLIEIPAGSTVEQAIQAAGLSLGSLDRTEPPEFTVLTPDSQVRLIRTVEEFEVEQDVIPFERQTLRNESLPEGKENEVYLQRGKNGLREITYRRVIEDGVEVSRNPIKSAIVEEPVPEIVMIGIQAPFYPVAIPGHLVYLRDGNAWMIEGDTGKRRTIVTTGDLDGRVLSLSDDGNWLLFTRRSDEEGQINSLWGMDIRTEGAQPIDLKVTNVIHFADWLPASNSKVIFSTVEPRSTAPGWQANNDLNVLRFSPNGWIKPDWDVILESNTGGVYGWWGMGFAWQAGGQVLAYNRPDGIGLINFSDGVHASLFDVIPFQTRGDWAWVPGISWGPDGKVLYFVDHSAPPGSTSPEESQLFGLSAIPLETASPLPIVSQVGMFAYPLASPQQLQPSGEFAYQVAYLQAIFPNQSETSRYRLMVMDRDGSNRRQLFPAEGTSGLEPQRDWGVWSPAPLPESGHFALAVIYQGNLWLVDVEIGQAQQVTGDGLTTRVIWR